MAEALVSMILDKLYSIISENPAANVRNYAQKMRTTFEVIKNVLADAETRQTEERPLREWLDKLGDICYDVDDVLDEWNTPILKPKIEGEGDNHANALVSKKMKKVCFSLVPSPCFCFNDQVVLRRDISLKLKALNERLYVIDRETQFFNFSFLRSENPVRFPYSNTFVDIAEICSRDDEKNILVSKLLSESNEEEKGLQTISIVGMGGVGKTTLAKLVYNDDKVKRYFDIRMWVCVSNPFDVLMITKSIMESLSGSHRSSYELETNLVDISQSIVGKKFFLVLDDVWTENYDDWQPLIYCLRNGLHGSKILITTRKESVARMVRSIYVITLKVLSGDKCWSLFCGITFFNRSPEECEKLEEIGREIVRKCQGLPLAIKAIGGILRFKRTREEWQMIRDRSMGQIEEFQKDIFPLLWLSYHDLPFMERQCFLFCAIFPKGHRINKDELIMLWMAQGYLGIKNYERMEAIGEKYFNHLVNRSLFQEYERDDNGSIISCKMHDIMHDFVQHASHECLSIQVNNDGEIRWAEKLRHSTLMLNKRISFPDSMFNAKKLRSLLLQYGVTNCLSISKILPKLYDELTTLRALDLSGQLSYENVIISIPKGIGRLIRLRYLNLSLLKIDALPEEVCELCNLQTLKLSWCTNLKELPQGMVKLINLRHFVNEGTSLSYMPRGIERLTGLLTLSEFVVGGTDPDDSKACTIESLKNMNNLQGSLLLKKLGAVTDVSAVEAKLEKKGGLVRLCLNFENDVEEVRMNENEEKIKHQKVIEALQPPPYLDFLEITGYRGNTFANWIASRFLRKLNFQNCTNIKHLPPLCNLQYLESLSLCNMWCVEKVNIQFWGIRSTTDHGASSSSPVIFFPRLISLKFVDMEELEEWDNGIAIMPNLQFLSLVHCPKLKALPDRILQTEKLQELNINWCRILKSRYNRGTGEYWDDISRIPNIMINFEYV